MGRDDIHQTLTKHQICAHAVAEEAAIVGNQERMTRGRHERRGEDIGDSDDIKPGFLSGDRSIGDASVGPKSA
ncbi:hypothetical protein J2793_005334 [Paraburkholderia caledonica]|uniref:Uncharacterized protein n=1 Tax=Paraburkholderia caledonica TaxID=134536 RepID=A0AB73IIK8_9BURK|nr:hypothetical protein [Paraburkholderia caledonica]